MTVLEDMNLVCTGHLDGSIVMYILPQPAKLPPITAQESREPQLLRLESARFKVRRCAQLLCRPHVLLVMALALDLIPEALTVCVLTLLLRSQPQLSRSFSLK